MAIKSFSIGADNSLKLREDIETEFGGEGGVSLSEYYSGGTYVPAGTTNQFGNVIPPSGEIKFSDFFGAQADIPAGGTVSIVDSIGVAFSSSLNPLEVINTIFIDVTTVQDEQGLNNNSWEVSFISSKLDVSDTAYASATRNGNLLSTGFKPTNAYVGGTIRAKVRFLDGDGNSNTLTSSPVSVVDTEGSVTVRINQQSAIAGTQLTTTTTSADANTIDSTTYQWFKAGNAIAGATSSSYTVVTGDVGSVISVTATITDELGNSTSNSDSIVPGNAAATATVGLATTPTGAALRSGVTLRASISNVVEPEGVASYTFVWRRDNTTVRIDTVETDANNASVDYVTGGTETGTFDVVITVTDDFGGTTDFTTNDLTVSSAVSYSITNGGNITEGGLASFTVTLNNPVTETISWNISDTNGRLFPTPTYPTSGTRTVSPQDESFVITAQTFADPEYTGTGTITLTVTGQGGTSSSSVNVTDANFTASISADSEVNEGQSITVSGTATNIPIPNTGWSVEVTGQTNGEYVTIGSTEDFTWVWNGQSNQYEASATIQTAEDASEYSNGTVLLAVKNASGNTEQNLSVTIINITPLPLSVSFDDSILNTLRISEAEALFISSTSDSTNAIVSGGVGPYTYSFSYTGDPLDGSLSTAVNGNQYTITLTRAGGIGPDAEWQGTVSVTVTDTGDNNKTASNNIGGRLLIDVLGGGQN